MSTEDTAENATSEPLTVQKVLEAAGLRGAVLDAVLKELDDVDRATYNWRLVRKADTAAATLELGMRYDGIPDAALNVLLQNIGANLAKAGVQMMQSRVDNDDEDDDLYVGYDEDEIH